MKYLKFGKGKQSVLILHEWLGDHRNWLDVMNFVDQEKFSFYLLDLPGYGLSSALKADYTIESCAESIIALADHLHLKTFSLVVHSMSGLIGHHLACCYSERIEKLVMFCPVPPTGFIATKEILDNMIRITKSRPALKQAILSRSGHLENNTWLTKKVNLAETASSAAVKRGYLQMFTSPTRAKPSNLNTNQVSIIYGEHDIPFYRPPQLNKVFSILYKKVRYILIKKCGHYPMLQQPIKTATILNAELRVIC